MKKEASLRGLIIVMAVLVNIIIIENGFVRSVNWYYLLTISLPALVLTWQLSRIGDDQRQEKP